MKFLCVYLGERRGGVTYACICMGIHSLSYRKGWWMLTKLGRDEVIMALQMRLGFSARSAQRWIQGGVKIGQWGALFQKDFFFISEWNSTTECILEFKYCDYTPRNKVRGVYWNHPVRLSVRLSVCLSFCRRMVR